MGAAQSERFDVIFMDMHMPIMNGLDAARKMRAMEGPGVEPLYIIGLTASHGPNEDRDCRDAGMDSVGEKPMNRKKLKMWLKRCAPQAAPPPPRLTPSSPTVGLDKNTDTDEWRL